MTVPVQAMAPSESPQATSVDLSIKLGSLRLANPVGLASGTCGYGLELSGFLDLDGLGAVYTKGLSLEPRPGNPPRRIGEVPAGMINRIGLQNVGLEVFVRDKIPALARTGAAVIPNLAGSTLDEYAEMAARLDGVPGVAALEINASCPNVTHGGIEFGTDPRALAELTSRVRVRTRLPLIVKLTPHHAIEELARAAESAGADALAAVNTVPALWVEPRVREGKLRAEVLAGGMSGPALRPIALRCARLAARATRLPVVGIGGIEHLQDILAFLAVGATAVQVGTATFTEPGIGQRLVGELADWVRAQGASRLVDLLPSREDLP